MMKNFELEVQGYINILGSSKSMVKQNCDSVYM